MSTRRFNPLDDARVEESISALVDLELERDELLPVIDRLVDSEALRRYYRSARDLDALMLEASQPSAGSAPVDAELWQQIRDRTRPEHPAGMVSVQTRRAGWLAMAAVLAVAAVAAWMVQDDPQRPVERAGASLEAAGDAIEVVLESDGDAMDDRRFVEMTAELLASDRRYHRKMREILELIGRQGGGYEGSQERSRAVADPEAAGALEAVMSQGGEPRRSL